MGLYGVAEKQPFTGHPDRRSDWPFLFRKMDEIFARFWGFLGRIPLQSGPRHAQDLRGCTGAQALDPGQLSLRNDPPGSA